MEPTGSNCTVPPQSKQDSIPFSTPTFRAPQQPTISPPKPVRGMNQKLWKTHKHGQKSTSFSPRTTSLKHKIHRELEDRHPQNPLTETESRACFIQPTQEPCPPPLKPQRQSASISPPPRPLIPSPTNLKSKTNTNTKKKTYRISASPS